MEHFIFSDHVCFFFNHNRSTFFYELNNVIIGRAVPSECGLAKLIPTLLHFIVQSKCVQQISNEGHNVCTLKRFGKVKVKATDTIRTKTHIKPQVCVVLAIHPYTHSSAKGKPKPIEGHIFIAVGNAASSHPGRDPKNIPYRHTIFYLCVEQNFIA